VLYHDRCWYGATYLIPVVGTDESYHLLSTGDGGSHSASLAELLQEVDFESYHTRLTPTSASKHFIYHQPSSPPSGLGLPFVL
jgi:phosphoglycerate dehydrogenase-like enzyme